MRKLVYITTPYFTCGVIVDTTNTIVECAPILYKRWHGKWIKELFIYIRSIGGSYQILEPAF
jgi:hypothetical protein